MTLSHTPGVQAPRRQPGCILLGSHTQGRARDKTELSVPRVMGPYAQSLWSTLKALRTPMASLDKVCSWTWPGPRAHPELCGKLAVSSCFCCPWGVPAPTQSSGAKLHPARPRLEKGDQVTWRVWVHPWGDGMCIPGPWGTLGNDSFGTAEGKMREFRSHSMVVLRMRFAARGVGLQPGE